MIQYTEMHLCVHAINKSIYIQYKYNFTLINQLQYTMNIQLRNNDSAIFNKKSARGILKVILCASEHICSIVRYCFRSYKQLKKDPLHVLTDANVLVLIDTDQSIFVNGRFSLPSDIHRPIIYA